MRRVDLKTVDALKKEMALEFKAMSQSVSMRRVVHELLPEIRAAMGRGYSLSEITKCINRTIPINEPTLRGYMYGKDRVDRPKPAKKKGQRSP